MLICRLWVMIPDWDIPRVALIPLTSTPHLSNAAFVDFKWEIPDWGSPRVSLISASLEYFNCWIRVCGSILVNASVTLIPYLITPRSRTAVLLSRSSPSYHRMAYGFTSAHLQCRTNNTASISQLNNWLKLTEIICHERHKVQVTKSWFALLPSTGVTSAITI